MYQRVLMTSSIKHEKEHVDFIQSVPILSSLTESQRVQVANTLKRQVGQFNIVRITLLDRIL